MVQSFVEATGDRVIDRWDRPQALPGGTLTIGYTIFTTGEDVRVAKDDPKVTSKVGWLPPPAVGQMAYFTLAMVRPNRQQIHLRHALPVAAFAMNTARPFWSLLPAAPSSPRRRSSCASSAGGSRSRDQRLWQPCSIPRSPGRCCMARTTPAAVTCSTSPSDCCRRVRELGKHSRTAPDGLILQLSEHGHRPWLSVNDRCGPVLRARRGHGRRGRSWLRPGGDCRQLGRG
jgi:hypothetical protein